MLYSRVESWRSLLRKVLADLAVVEQWKFDVLKKIGMTSSDLENVLLAIVQKESSGDQYAPDGDGGCSIGLMQLNWCVNRGNPDVFSVTSSDFSGTPALYLVTNKEDLRDPYVNLSCGSRYFLGFLNQFSDVNAAVLSYNGPREGAEYYASGDTETTDNFPYLTAVLSYLEVPVDYFSTLLEKKTPLLALGMTLLGAGVFGYVLLKSSRKSSHYSGKVSNYG